MLNTSWLLRHASEQWFSVVITLNDPERNIDTTVAIAGATSVVSLLAKEAEP